ncbi:MAG: hypothetical protein AAGI70_17620 [Pseudomonadota bacterium]
MRFLLALLLLPALALADEEVVSPEEFRDFAEGHTLYFEQGGETFGSETFEEDGVVRWRYRNGVCVDGAWRARGAQICFLYEGQDEVLCWRMFRDSEGLLARLLNGENPGMELRITGRDKRPLLCGAPPVEL